MCAGYPCAKCSATAGVRRAAAAPREAAHHHPAAARRPAAAPGLCTAAAAAGPAPWAAVLSYGWACACLRVVLPYVECCALVLYGNETTGCELCCLAVDGVLSIGCPLPVGNWGNPRACRGHQVTSANFRQTLHLDHPWAAMRALANIGQPKSATPLPHWHGHSTMAVHVRHARLVLTYVGATLLVACWALSSSSPKSLSITHPAAETDVQRAAKFVLLNAVLGISAASILFCSVGFSIAGAIVFAQRERKETDRLHHSDSLPAEALLARQRRETAAHTLTAANVAVAALWLGFAYALDGLRCGCCPASELGSIHEVKRPTVPA